MQAARITWKALAARVGSARVSYRASVWVSVRAALPAGEARGFLRAWVRCWSAIVKRILVPLRNHSTWSLGMMGVMICYYLGCPKPHWLERDAPPLFVSRRVLSERKKLPRSRTRWALDSGGFTELQMHGQWTVTPRQYVYEIRRYVDEIGKLEWAAPQDWMCEPIVIAGGSILKGPTFKGTGLSVRSHLIRTVANLIELRTIAPELPIIPVLQGWQLDHYLQCWDLYDMAGICLEREPVIGIGSVCRRQATKEAVAIFERLAIEGIAGKMHGFGVKTAGLPAIAKYLRSADSQARSFHARKQNVLLPGHDKPGSGRPKGHKNCANCFEYLVAEHHRMLELLQHREQKQRTIWEIC